MADKDDDLGEDEDQEAGGAEGAEPEKKRGKGKLIAMIAVGVLLLGGIGGGAAFFLGLFGGHPAPKEEVDLSAPPIYHEMPKLLVDLKTGECRAPYLKLQVVAGISGPEAKAALVAAEVKLVDKIQIHLRSLTRQDLVGREGATKLRFDLMTMIDEIIAPHKVRELLYREFLLQ